MKKDLPVWIVIYLLCMGSIVWGMQRARKSATVTFQTKSAHEEWEVFREDVREAQKQDPPVKREVPKSDSPPALILMRDHFTACLTLALVLSSALFFTLMLVTRGAMQPTVIRED